MAQHTPGPWAFGHVSGEIYQADDRRSYPTIAAVDLTRPQAIADGELIAAAPDLLAALKGFVEAEEDFNPDGKLDDPLRDAYAAAKAAIAKAEGRT